MANRRLSTVQAPALPSAFAKLRPISAAAANPAALYLASLSKGSRPTMTCSLTKIARFFGAKSRAALPWHLLRYEHTLGLRTHVAASYAPATANRYLAALRGVMRSALRLELISESDYRRAIDLPAVRGSRLLAGRALGAGELRSLFQICQTERAPLGARDAAILALIYGCGLRRQESVDLDMDDVDGNALKVRGKGNKHRIVYLHPAGQLAVDAWVAARGSSAGPLLLPMQGRGSRCAPRRMSADTVLGAVERLAELAGIEHCSPHDFRRSFVSDLLDAGADLKAVQELMGHSNINTTARYDRRGERAKHKAIELLSVPYYGPPAAPAAPASSRSSRT